MRRLLISIALLTSLLCPMVVATSTAGAVDVFQQTCTNNQGSGSGSAVCRSVRDQQGSQDNPIIAIIRVAVQIIAYIIGIAAIVGLVVSAIRIIISGGDSNAVTSARSAIISSLVGIAVAVLALLIVKIIIGK